MNSGEYPPPQNPQQPQYYNQPTGVHQTPNNPNDEQTWQSQPLPPYTHYPHQPDVPPPPSYQPPPQPSKKPSFWKRKIAGLPMWLFVAIVIISVAAASSALANNTTSNNTVTQITPTATPDIAATNVSEAQATQDAATPFTGTPINTGYTPPPSNSSNSNAKVGDTITLNDVDATLTKVKVGPVDQYSTPKPDNEFVTVHVKLSNHSGSEQTYNQLDFHVKSGSGNITDLDAATYGDGINDLGNGTLTDGGTAEGNIVFQVKKGDHKVMLTWQPNFNDNVGDNGWLLGL